MAEENLKNVKKKSRKVILWIFSILLIIGLADYYNYWGVFEEDSKELKSKTPTQICNEWKNRYPVIAHNQFPEGTLKTYSGETWVIQLDPKEWSGTVELQNRYANMKPAGSVEILLPNGVIIEDNPNKDIHLQNKNGFRFKGENCYKISN